MLSGVDPLGCGSAGALLGGLPEAFMSFCGGGTEGVALAGGVTGGAVSGGGFGCLAHAVSTVANSETAIRGAAGRFIHTSMRMERLSPRNTMAAVSYL